MIWIYIDKARSLKGHDPHGRYNDVEYQFPGYEYLVDPPSVHLLCDGFLALNEDNEPATFTEQEDSFICGICGYRTNLSGGFPKFYCDGCNRRCDDL